jgi:hypothetical protein
VELFCDDPDAVVARAVECGAQGRRDPVRDHQAPWGPIGRAGSSIRSGTSGSWATSPLCVRSRPDFSGFRSPSAANTGAALVNFPALPLLDVALNPGLPALPDFLGVVVVLVVMAPPPIGRGLRPSLW